MGQTSNYGLKQWESWEQVKRGEVNGVVSGVDTALAGLEADKAELVTGSYTGDGAGTQAVSLGFRPRAVLVVSYSGLNTDVLDHMLVQLAFDGLPAEQVTITDSGFTVCFRMNDTSWGAYHYLAVK